MNRFKAILIRLVRRRRIMIAVFLAAFVILATVVLLRPSAHQMTYDRFYSAVTAKQVKDVSFNTSGHEATVTFTDGKKQSLLYSSEYEDDLQNQLHTANVPFSVVEPGFFGKGGGLAHLAPWLPFLILLGIAGYSYSSGQGRKKALRRADIPNQRFADVIGATEAIDELRQVVRCLRAPATYGQLGIRPLTGVLLYGPPGTGKTLLARAVAGEAGVPFYEITGSEFDDRYIGTGPSRVRSLFTEARKHDTPAIIFIDEIDAVGGERGENTDSGTKAYNQTLNQLLAEMDGFASRTGPMVIVIGATNRLDALDAALTRPGRLTRKVAMPTPDRHAREEILRMYAAKLPNVAVEVNYPELARLTTGMSGADLAELVNQAGLTADREAHQDATEPVPYTVTPDHFMQALESAEIGPARKSVHVAERDRRITAVHEAGHVIAGTYSSHPVNPRKVSIVPRGRAGGVTWATAGDEQLQTRGELFGRLVYFMGARAAERLVFGDDGYTTGAHDDIYQATELATAMVRDYGMIGDYRAQIDFADDDPRVDEIHGLLRDAETAAASILRLRRGQLDALAAALLDAETLEGPDLEAVLAAADQQRVPFAVTEDMRN